MAKRDHVRAPIGRTHSCASGVDEESKDEESKLDGHQPWFKLGSDRKSERPAPRGYLMSTRTGTDAQRARTLSCAAALLVCLTACDSGPCSNSPFGSEQGQLIAATTVAKVPGQQRVAWVVALNGFRQQVEHGILKITPATADPDYWAECYFDPFLATPQLVECYTTRNRGGKPLWANATILVTDHSGFEHPLDDKPVSIDLSASVTIDTHAGPPTQYDLEVSAAFTWGGLEGCN